MRKKLICKRNFTENLQVTDPCYDKDVWCRLNLKIKAGKYSCYIWKQKIKSSTSTYYYEVGIIGMYLNSKNGNCVIPDVRTRELTGYIGVDAGLAGFFNDKPDFTDEQWHNLCDFVSAHRNDMFYKIKEGVFADSGYGDGEYPVYVYYNTQHEITGVEIQFL